MNNIDVPKKSKFNAYAVEWIKANLYPLKGYSNVENSYGLKHRFEHATGLYMDNGEFKYAMREAGFEPLDENDKNWRYKISRKSPGLEWVSSGTKRDRYSLSNYQVKDWKPTSEEEAIKISEELEQYS